MRIETLSFRTLQTLVLVLTFLSYASYHATRKTTSIVKSVLDPKTAELGLSPWPSPHILRTHASGWAPFNTPSGTSMLGLIDLAFLSVYSLGMYFAGHLGDRLNLRFILTIGMLGTGLFTALFGVGYWLNVHSFYYYLIVQILAGLFQSTGWPSVVAIVGNWFGKRKRGLIMGIWNAHTSVGNISGSLIASALLTYGWGWSFVVPGILISIIGLTVFLFLPESPEAVGMDKNDAVLKPRNTAGNDEPDVNGGGEEIRDQAVGFMEAWGIPGVAPFAFCLFFSKLVAYTFLYWLPFYISHKAIGGEYLSDSTAGMLSSLFDVGGVFGGILAGHVSDHLDARAITAASFMYCAIPALFLYHAYGSISLFCNAALMIAAGLFVNGPYALITTAVSADLGTHGSLKGNSRALATVTGIIDATGSVGAAIGPLLTGYLSSRSWDSVFIMLMLAALIAGLLLTKLVIAEVKVKLRTRSSSSLEESLI
ncbi:putative glycerol-3-phosphate transporter 1 [Platanthera guangdongensis]|uniref:Glycerol-3-phosphate transporter 1 n=1 Tax=Platanthera guangdongensis TaxID=2320717 RepID=A0ABR2LQ36_9ASPA